MENIKRNTAYKVWIADVISSKYLRGQEQFDAGYVEVNGNKISRVNILGSIVDKFINENSVSFNLDDGSGAVRLRTWNDSANLFDNIEIGDMVLVIGKVKEYNNFIYVAPEVIKKLDNPLWLKVRKLELVKMYGDVKRVDNIAGDNLFTMKSSDDDAVMNIAEEKVENNIINPREIVLSLIEKLDFGDGADINDLVKKIGFNSASDVINDLLLNGEIFELHKGKLRVTG